MELSPQELTLKIFITSFLLLPLSQEYEIFSQLEELRKGDSKTQAVLYDIADDITHLSRRNYTLNHLIERIKIYNEEKFNYEIVQIDLGEKWQRRKRKKKKIF